MKKTKTEGKRKKEYVAIIDRNDRVIGNAEKHYAVSKKLGVRISSILIKNKKGEILLQQRSKIVLDPLLWSTSAGGFVSFGETYHSAAKRELLEEIGIKAKLKPIAKLYREKSGRHVALFVGHHEGPFKPNREVKQVKFFTLSEIMKLIRGKPKMFKGTFVDFFEKYHDVIKNA